MSKAKFYDGKADYYNLVRDKDSTHSIIIETITNSIEKGKALDVGCSTGYIGRLLKDMGFYVVGIDISKRAIDKAKKYIDKAYVCDIENCNFDNILDEKFDVIILADVIEHLFDPEQVLVVLKKFLNENGFFVISIPNIANWRARLSLLLGKWEYKRTGLFDYGHIRFFTLESFTKLLKSCGLKIVDMKIFPRKGKYKILNKIFPRLFSFQYIIKARPS